MLQSWEGNGSMNCVVLGSCRVLCVCTQILCNPAGYDEEGNQLWCTQCCSVQECNFAGCTWASTCI